MEVLIALEHLLDSNWVYANMALPGGNSFCTLRTKHANDHLPAVVNPILSIEKALLPFWHSDSEESVQCVSMGTTCPHHISPLDTRTKRPQCIICFVVGHSTLLHLALGPILSIDRTHRPGPMHVDVLLMDTVGPWTKRMGLCWC